MDDRAVLEAAPLTRRGLLVVGCAALVGLVAGCSGDDATDSSAGATSAAGSGRDELAEPSAPSTLTTADFAGLGTCVLLPEMTAGPFPNLEQLDRRDITEGYPGHPLRLGLRVVDGECAAVSGATVEVWHADASGDYSAYDDGGSGKDEGGGTTFLRGRQTADEDGIVEFASIYPGWYQGRAVHIHVDVDVGGEDVLTSQLFFPDAYSVDVFASGAYAEFGPPDTTNATDGLGGDIDRNGSLLSLSSLPSGSGTLALLNLGVES
jgi:protocatechuate 3,4-dioxygenase beta subunit